MRATRGEAEAERRAEDRILGLDNVPLELPLATAASRSLAAFLDYFVLGALSVAWIVGLTAFGATRTIGVAWLVGLGLLGFFAIEYGYFAGSEMLMAGQTLGKRALGLRVVTRTGAQPGAGAFLIRNCVRSIDLFIGVLLMALDAQNRRLGDRLAGTLVVRTRRREAELVMIERVPRGWQAREIAIAEGFLRRLPGLEPARAEGLARLLLDAVLRSDPGLSAELGPGEPAIPALRRLLGAGPDPS